MKKPVSKADTRVELQQEMDLLKMTTPLVAAAEYYLDDYFDGLLETKSPLLTINNKMV